ncbi:MAG: DNA-binding transcriptional regulator Fis [Pseudomonadota bacterium]|nr:DNA-binding transcriptional regulator Fis [Pseudomonadota bacterium]MDO7667820.1 DNA-binding transcriptional regulator Fis [Pseudomonadota bacterium]MDO7710675.1 DNA-binding transcriptional regulator Fis [Pseudomonadota bacterium]
MNDSNKTATTCFALAVAEELSHAPLGECVETALKDYFKHLEGHPAANLYEMLLAEVEAPLFKATLEHTNGNQSRAAEILGLNRGTLRKKLKTYGL